MGKEKNLTFLLLFKKILGKEKNFFLKCAEQIKYGSNVYATFQKKKYGNKVRLHYSKRS